MPSGNFGKLEKSLGKLSDRDMKLQSPLHHMEKPDDALCFATGILGEQASGVNRRRVWSLPDNVANLGVSIRGSTRIG